MDFLYYYSSQSRGPSKARSEQRITVAANGGYPVVSSPPSDEVDIFDSHCFATTPSSSNASECGNQVPMFKVTKIASKASNIFVYFRMMFVYKI